MFGLVGVYNKLPAKIVESSASVATFQTALQELLLSRAASGKTDWRKLLSPRWQDGKHPLNEVA